MKSGATPKAQILVAECRHTGTNATSRHAGMTQHSSSGTKPLEGPKGCTPESQAADTQYASTRLQVLQPTGSQGMAHAACRACRGSDKGGCNGACITHGCRPEYHRVCQNVRAVAKGLVKHSSVNYESVGCPTCVQQSVFHDGQAMITSQQCVWSKGSTVTQPQDAVTTCSMQHCLHLHSHPATANALQHCRTNTPLYLGQGCMHTASRCVMLGCCCSQS